MIRLCDVLDRLIRWLGEGLAWLTGLMALLTAAVVVLRYLFDQNTVVLQESVMYLHALVFLLGIPYTLQRDGHVRVDLLYSRFSPRGRALVDALGGILLLLPVALFIGLSSLPYVAASWRVLEGSSEVGGLPAVFLLKTLIPVMAALLALQGLSLTLRRLVELTGSGQSA